jgi:hypothetical protein
MIPCTHCSKYIPADIVSVVTHHRVMCENRPVRDWQGEERHAK